MAATGLGSLPRPGFVVVRDRARDCAALHAAYLRPDLLEAAPSIIATVTSWQCGKENDPVNGKNRSIARLTAIVVVVGLIGLASMACARRGPAATSTPSASLAAQPSGTVEATSAASDAPSIAAPDSSPSASARGSSVGAPTVGASRTAAPAATPDPLDSELRALDQIVNDVNGSISGSDTSASGGE